MQLQADVSCDELAYWVWKGAVILCRPYEGWLLVLPRNRPRRRTVLPLRIAVVSEAVQRDLIDLTPFGAKITDLYANH